jgi:tetratricopeptide (TPR) repeat protein
MSSLLCLFVFASVCAENPRSAFQAANSYYKNKQYEEAAHLYLNVLQKDRNNISAAYNLGNTYFHLQKYPEAVLYYEKALKLQPDNKHIRQNLEQTNGKLFTKIEFGRAFFVAKYSKSFFNSKSSNQWGTLMLIFLWLGAIFLCIYFFTSSRLSRNIAFASFAFTVVFAFFTRSRLKLEKASAYGIVMLNKAPLLQTPVASSKNIDSLQEGLKVKLVDNDSGWLKVELPNGTSGWTKDQHVALI